MNADQQQVDQWLQEHHDLSRQQRWRFVIDSHRRSRFSHEACCRWWTEIFHDGAADGCSPAPVWCPEPADVADSNITEFCHRNGLADYDALHRWSVDQRGDFWRAVLAIWNPPFHQPPDRILNLDSGPEHARWLEGATWNVAMFALPELSSSTGLEMEPAVIFSQPDGTIRQWSRQELADRVKRVAAALRKAGLQDQSIAMFLPMTPWSVAIYLGIILAGGTVVSIADSFSAPEIRRRLDIVDCQWVVTYPVMERSGREIDLLGRVRAASKLGAPLSCLVLDSDHAQLSRQHGEHDFGQWIQDADPADCRPALGDAETTINLLFSSGTTGDPKAIPWTHATPLKCAADGWFHQDLHPGDVVAWPTNLGWMMGPWLIFAALMNRSVIALYHDAPAGSAFGRFVQDAKVTMLGLVPSMVKSWRASGDMESMDWSAIRCFSSTGESSNASDYFYLSWLAGFKPIIEYCGGTEIGGGYITSTVVQCNVPAAFSTPAVGLDFVLLDEQGVPASEGELFLIPPSIGLSQRLQNRDHHETYFEGVPEYQGLTLRRHGDHFRSLAGGYYEAGGRADDTMNLGGIKVSSVELERAINQLPGVQESAAVAVDRSQHGPSELVMFLVLLPEASTQIEVWLQQCNRQLKQELNPLFKVSEVRLIDRLPRTASNKIMRRLLRDAH